MNEILPKSSSVPGAVKCDGQKGFSLLEMLVAFTILAFSLVVILRIFASGINTAVTAEEYTAAVQIAESIMAETGVVKALQEGIIQGVEQQKYGWEVDTRLYESGFENQPRATSDDDDEEDYEAPKLYQITVIVSWGDDDFQGREVKLQTLRLASIPIL